MYLQALSALLRALYCVLSLPVIRYHLGDYCKVYTVTGEWAQDTHIQ